MRRVVSVLLLLLLLAICRQACPAELQSNGRSTVLVNSTTGRIQGLVLDEQCGDGLRYAKIMVLGTDLEATSDSLGQFFISGVLPGRYRMKAVMLRYRSAEMEAVEVLASQTTTVEFKLPGFWAEEIRRDPLTVAPECQVHHIPTEIVLVPVSHGLNVLNQEYENLRRKEFPYAEPWVDGGCVLFPGMKLKSWTPRCWMCVAARNQRFAEANLLDFETRVPTNWETYRVNDVSFSAPAAATREVKTTGCGRTDRFDTGSLSIRTYLGSWRHIPRFYLDGKHPKLGRIISHVYSELVVDRGEHGVTIVGIFRVLPVGTNTFAMAISTDEGRDLDSALAVLNSVTFPEE